MVFNKKIKYEWIVVVVVALLAIIVQRYSTYSGVEDEDNDDERASLMPRTSKFDSLDSTHSQSSRPTGTRFTVCLLYVWPGLKYNLI